MKRDFAVTVLLLLAFASCNMSVGCSSIGAAQRVLLPRPANDRSLERWQQRWQEPRLLPADGQTEPVYLEQAANADVPCFTAYLDNTTEDATTKIKHRRYGYNGSRYGGRQCRSVRRHKAMYRYTYTVRYRCNGGCV